ncbi:MAG: methyltransferase domain-containing protein [Syntrophobacter sp.]
MACTICGQIMAHMTADLWACPACALVTSDIGPDASIYGKEYHEKYVRYANTELGEQVSRARWELVSRHMSKGVLLDYGCGAGHFAQTNPNGCFRVIGYDINPYSGVENPMLGQFQAEGVTFWDSLEHVGQPMVLVDSLRPEFLFITAPDALSLPSVFLPEWRHYRPAEHVHYFSRPSFRKMAQVLGYEVLEFNNEEGTIRNPDHPDWLLSMAARRIR